MKKFLNLILYIFIKPLTAIILYSGNDKFIRYANKKKFIMVLFTLMFGFLFLFEIIILPLIIPELKK